MKTIHAPLGTMMILALAGLGIPTAQAGGLCCDRCGCESGLRKICRKVCETKKVAVPCWSSKCEDVCLPRCPDVGPLRHMLAGCGGCGKCTRCAGQSCGPAACGGCGTCQKCTCGPESSCADIITRKKLLFREVEKEVPVAKWVVETVCDACGCVGPAAEGAPGLEETPEEAAPESPATEGAEPSEAEGETPPPPQPVNSARLFAPRLQAITGPVREARLIIRNPFDLPSAGGTHVRPVTFPRDLNRSAQTVSTP